MSVCDGSDNEDLEVKQEPMDSDSIKSKELVPVLKSEDGPGDSQDVCVAAQLQKGTKSGMAQVMKWRECIEYVTCIIGCRMRLEF